MFLSNDYKEYVLGNTLVLLFQKMGFEYKSFPHLIPKDGLPLFLGVEGQQSLESVVKEFYLATTKRQDKWFFLRPEITYISIASVDQLQQTFYSYSGYCFRNERKQFCRFKEFLQLGVEAIFSNISKRKPMLFYQIIFCNWFIHNICTDKFIKEDVVLMLFYKTLEEKAELEHFYEINKDFFKCTVEIMHIKRQGNGVTPYSGIAFEYHVYNDADGTHEQKKLYEIMGGGEYDVNGAKAQYFGSGFGVGSKRFMLLEIDFTKIADFLTKNTCSFIKQENNVRMNINLKQFNSALFAKKLIEIFQNFDINNIPNISINFTKNDNKVNDQIALG